MNDSEVSEGSSLAGLDLKDDGVPISDEKKKPDDDVAARFDEHCCASVHSLCDSKRNNSEASEVCPCSSLKDIFLPISDEKKKPDDVVATRRPLRRMNQDFSEFFRHITKYGRAGLDTFKAMHPSKPQIKKPPNTKSTKPKKNAGMRFDKESFVKLMEENRQKYEEEKLMPKEEVDPMSETTMRMY